MIVLAQLPEKLVESLRFDAERLLYQDREDWYPIDQGNYDDAFEAGERDGATVVAREVLDALGIPYTVKEAPR